MPFKCFLKGAIYAGFANSFKIHENYINTVQDKANCWVNFLKWPKFLSESAQTFYTA